MYKIELLADGWKRSWSFPGEYTLAEAELRGAIAMLDNARHHVVDSVGVKTQAGFDAFVILMSARLDCVRHLETL
jgi:hypothetical protein